MISWLDGWLNTNESPIKFSHSSKTDVTLEKVKVWKTARSSGRIKLRPYVGCFGLFSFILIWPIAQRAYRQIKQTPDSFSFVWFRLFSLFGANFQTVQFIEWIFFEENIFLLPFWFDNRTKFQSRKRQMTTYPPKTLRLLKGDVAVAAGAPSWFSEMTQQRQKNQR